MLPQFPPPQLLGPDGRPISSAQFKPVNTKADPPKLGHAFGNWAGRDVTFATLPGGGVVQFDLTKLRTEDFRSMRDHYQVNASLAVLSFMQHQSDFHVECEDKKIAAEADIMLHDNWTMLNRAMSQANWAGYSPAVLEWDADVQNRRIPLTKVMDLVPEECRVNWELEEGWAPPGRVKPKFRKFAGIVQYGQPGWPIPVENSFWYPLLMENGDYYGRKLLRPAFQSWFFSILLHLFANRYYERFGEPTPIGRAPFGEKVNTTSGEMDGNVWMLQILQQLRNRSVVVLPNDKTQLSNSVYDYDYAIEYLESQMRGADFDRYMTRLDEEISIGLFMPILLFRTADVGSYNLGTQHSLTYQMMLNSMNGDRKEYVDRYVLSKWTDYNYSPNAPRPKMVYTKLGQANLQLITNVLTTLVKNGKATFDYDELGQMVGMTVKQVRQTTAPPGSPGPAPASDPNEGPSSNPANDPNAPANKERIVIRSNLSESRATAAQIKKRVCGQVGNAFRENKFSPDMRINMGFKRRFTEALSADGVGSADRQAEEFYKRMDSWLADVLAISDEFESADAFTGMFERVLDNELARLV